MTETSSMTSWVTNCVGAGGSVPTRDRPTLVDRIEDVSIRGVQTRWNVDDERSLQIRQPTEGVAELAHRGRPDAVAAHRACDGRVVEVPEVGCHRVLPHAVEHPSEDAVIEHENRDRQGLVD